MRIRVPLLPTVLLALVAACSSVPDSQPATAAPPAPQAAPSQPAAPAPPAAPAGLAAVSMAYPTGERATSAILVEKFAPAEVQVGSALDYELRITNLTSLSLQNVVVTDSVGGEFRLQSSQPQAAGGSTAGELRWVLETLPPRETRSIRVSGTATGPGVVSSCAEVSWNSALCIATRVIEPKLELAKSGPAEVLLCEPIPYRFVVTNRGTGPARNVVVRDELPDGLVAADGTRLVTQPVGTLPAGEAREFTVAVRAQRPGNYVNRAAAGADGGLKAESGSVATRVVAPSLALVKEGPARQYAGRNATYVLTLTNSGDGVARNAVIEDQIPAGTTLVRASEGATVAGNRVVWQLGNLEPRGSRRVELTVNATQIGLVRNTGTAQAFCAEAVSATAETAFEGIPAVLLEVVDVDDPIQVGDNETYVITVTNQGTAPDRDIRITCTLDRLMQYVSSTGPTQASVSGSTVTFAPLASLPAKAQAQWTLVVKALDEGDARFGVQMNTAELTRPVDETEATHFYK